MSVAGFACELQVKKWKDLQQTATGSGLSEVQDDNGINRKKVPAR